MGPAENVTRSFRELRVWKAAIDLTILVYDLTADFPKHELYGLSSQMRRASVSIASNVAEGSARRTRRDFRQFVVMARGSNSELQTQLVIATRLGYAAEQKLKEAESLACDVGKMLHGLSHYLRPKPDVAPTPVSIPTESVQRST